METAKIILDKVISSKKAKVKNWPCHSNRASSIGHPCERYLVLSRTAWDKKALYDWEVQCIFDEGNRQEKAVEDDLREAGFDIVEQQRPFVDKALQITGHIDGKIAVNGSIIPFEVKSMAPHIWFSINSVQDMFTSRYVWVRKYPGQMSLYLFMDNKDYGIFILKNKSNGLLKILDFNLDYEYTESLLKKVERVNQHIENNTLPDCVGDAEICTRCEFVHICLPDMGGVEFTDGKIVDLLDERRDLEKIIEKSDIPDYQKRAKEINELIRTIFKDRPVVIAGSYLITGKWVNSGKGKYWKVDVACAN